VERIATRGFLSNREFVSGKSLVATDFRALFFRVRYLGARAECRYLSIECFEHGTVAPTGNLYVRVFDAEGKEVSLSSGMLLRGGVPLTPAERLVEIDLDRARRAHRLGNPATPARNAHLARLPGLTGGHEVVILDPGLGFDDFPSDPPSLPEPPAPPPPPDPVEKVRFRLELDPNVHPEGRWRAEFHNLSGDEIDLHYSVDFPNAVVEVKETRIPYSLLRHAYDELTQLLNLRITLDDGEVTIQVSRELAQLSGIPQETRASIPADINDIQFSGSKFVVGEPSTFRGTAAFVLDFNFEDGGPREVDLPGVDLPLLPKLAPKDIPLVGGVLGSINLSDIALQFVLYVGRTYEFDPASVYTVRNGEAAPASVFMRPDLNLPNLDIGKWGKTIDKLIGLLHLPVAGIRERITDAVSSAQLVLRYELLPAFYSYFIDAIQHLAQRDHVIHAITGAADALLVRHHEVPSVRPLGPADLGGAGLATEGVSAAAGPSARRRMPGLPRLELLARPRPPLEGEGEGENDEERSECAVPTAVTSSRTLSLAGLALGREHARHTTTGVLDVRPARREGVEHVVVLMLENRSFDHMLGYLKLRHRVECDGLVAGMANAETLNPNYPLAIHHLERTVNLRSPHHGFTEVARQIAGGAMTGFVDSYATWDLRPDLGQRLADVMGHYDERDLPFFHFAAQNYAICDRWFGAHPGGTFPNRFIALSGRTPELENYSLEDPRVGYTDLSTIFELLSAQGVTWKYVEHDIGFLRMYDRYRLDERNMTRYACFIERLEAGELPQVTWIDPAFVDVPSLTDANDDHAPADTFAGQHLCGHLYRALTRNPDLWRRTLLIITYDEHGGFYDHVSPVRPEGSLPRVHPDSPSMYGPRVPTLLLSPWVNAGQVIHTEFDHTSLIRTLMKLFCEERFLDREMFGPRVDRAADLLGDLRTAPRAHAPSFEVALPAPKKPSLEALHQRERSDYHELIQVVGLSSWQRERLG